MKKIQNIENISLFLKDPISFAKKLNNNSSKEVYLGHKKFIYIYKPEVALKILSKHSDIFLQNKMIFSRIKPVTGEKGLVQLQGEESLKMRKLIMPHLLNPQSLGFVNNIILKNTNDLIQELSHNNQGTSFEVNISKVMTKLILRSAFEMFLGIDLVLINEELIKNYLELNALCGERMRSILALPLAIPTPTNQRILKLEKEIKNEVSAILNKQGSSPLLNVLEKDPNILDHCLTFLFAGHETMAASLSFTFLNLANMPESQKEMMSGDKKIINAFYNETLRMYPPAYMLVRECSKNTTIDGVNFKKNDQVILPLSELHRCPKSFQSPNKFKPNRFLSSKHHPGSFIPFGTGPKSCVGTSLAYLEAQIVIKEICKHFELYRSQNQIETNAYITLHPNNNQIITFKRRSS